MSTIIKTLRDAKGLTQAQLAKEVGVSQQAVQLWEAGPSVPRGKNLKKAAEVLGTDEKTLKSGRPAEVDMVEFKQDVFDVLGEVAKGKLALEVRKNNVKWRFDYLSDAAAVEVVPGDSANRLVLMEALWHLASYHAASGLNSVLVIVGDPDRTWTLIVQQRLTVEASLLGVNVYRIADITDLPDMIKDVEHG